MNLLLLNTLTFLTISSMAFGSDQVRYTQSENPEILQQTKEQVIQEIFNTEVYITGCTSNGISNFREVIRKMDNVTVDDYRKDDFTDTRYEFESIHGSAYEFLSYSKNKSGGVHGWTLEYYRGSGRQIVKTTKCEKVVADKSFYREKPKEGWCYRKPKDLGEAVFGGGGPLPCDK